MSRKTTNVGGHRLLDHIQKLVAEDDVRRICIMDEQRSLLEIPANLGDPAAPASVLRAPMLAAIKSFATLTHECIVELDTAEKRT
jgi:hypothetical protein